MMNVKKYPWFLVLSLLLCAQIETSFAQPDSVRISGRILNLTPALYRQAPVITFTRNNILQPQSELTRQALIEADGSFSVSLPLIYPKEEVYLDYGGKVYTTFLAAPGSLQVSFDADSLFKAKRLFYFSGVNAEANNQYILYLMEEDRLLKENKRYGESFFNTLWASNPSEARRMLDHRAELRLSALLPISQKESVSPLLQSWVEAIVYDEQLASFYEYALINETQVEQSSKDSLIRLLEGTMTFQRVQLMIRFGDYADRLIERYTYLNPNQSKTLSVEKMATLLKVYTKPLSSEEADRLDVIIREESTSQEGLEFLSLLYRRNRRTMDLVTMIEKKELGYGREFDPAIAGLLDARTLIQQFFQLSLEEQKLLYGYIRPKITEPVVGNSLEELYKLEVKDSTYIKLIQKRTDLSTSPTEVLSGIWISQSNESGKDWLNKVLDVYKDKTLYVIKWNLFDENSRNEILYAPALRAQLPTDVEFLYIYLPNMELNDSPDLWKKYIVRNKLKGIHMFLRDDQAIQLLFKLNPMASPSFAIIQPGGKYFTRNAPPPGNGQEAAQMLLKAREVR